MRRILLSISRLWLRIQASDSIFSSLVGTILLGLRFLPFLSGQTILFGDNYSLMVPGKLFTASWLAEGILPLWNPYLFAGISWIGDINQSLLHPSTILFWLFSPAAALNLTIFLQLLVSFVAMYFLTRQFVSLKWAAILAAVLWTFSPQITGPLNTLATLQSITLLPLVVLCGLLVTKGLKYQILFAVTVFFQLAGGYPLHVFYSVLVAIIFSAFLSKSDTRFKKTFPIWIKQWVGTGVLCLGLTAVLWLPFVQTLPVSTRSIQTQAQAAVGSLQPYELLKSVLPTLFDNPAQGYKWGPSWSRSPNFSLYFGWFSFVLVVWWLIKGKKTKLDAFLLLVSFGATAYAFGEILPGYSFIRTIPILGSARGVSTVLMIPALLLSLWLATIFNSLANSAISRRFLTFLGGLLVGLSVISILGYLAVQTHFDQLWFGIDAFLGGRLTQSAFHTVDRDQIIFSTILFSLLLVSVVTLCALLALQKKWFGCIVVLVAIDLAYFSSGYFWFGSGNLYTISPEEQSVVKLLVDVDLQNYRVLTRNYNAPYTDFGAYAEALTVRSPFSDSYVDEEELREFAHAQRMRDGLTPDWNEVVGVPIIHGYTTLLPADMHTVFSKSADIDPSINDLPEIKTSNPELQRWATKYYIVDKWFPTYGEVFPEKVTAEDDRWAVYEIPGVLSRFRFDNEQPVELLSHVENPNRIALTFVNDINRSSLIVADRYDKDWQAVVNGQGVAMENFGGLRKIPIQPGQNEVVMTYVPRAFYWGLSISLVTLGCLLFGMVWHRRRHY